MTLNDLKRRNGPYFAFFHGIRQIFRPIISQWLKIYCLLNIVSQFQSSTFGENYNAPCSMVSLQKLSILLFFTAVRYSLCKCSETILCL